MCKYKKEIIKPLILILFIVVYYFVSDFVKINYSNKQNYIPYYIWTYIWTFILGLIFSYEYIKNVVTSGKIKIDLIFLTISLCILTMYIPNTPLFNFLIKGKIEILILIFWYSVIHVFKKCK